MIRAFLIMGLLLLASGCGRMPGAGLLVNNGISSPNEVRYVVYQASGWTMPQPQLLPLRRPIKITDKAAIEAFYNALNHPAGGPKPKIAPNTRVGFVANNGRVAIFAVGGSQGGCESCDANLGPVTSMAFATPKQREFDTTTVATGVLTQLTYHSRGGIVVLKPGTRLTRLESTWTELLRTYNPLSLRGNVYCSQQELKRFLAWTPEYVKVELKKPVAYKAIIVPPDLDPKWPPSRGDSRSTLTSLRYDTVYVARLPETRREFVRFIFSLSSTGECIATDAVHPRTVTGYSGRGQPSFGPDLFEGVVSTLTRS